MWWTARVNANSTPTTRAACELAGIRKIRFHDLRHTCATLLLEQGVQLVTIKELLGHSQLHTTAEIYSHVRIRTQRSAIEAMKNALSEPDEPDYEDIDDGDDDPDDPPLAVPVR